jgi:hypothetical protein
MKLSTFDVPEAAVPVVCTVVGCLLESGRELHLDDLYQVIMDAIPMDLLDYAHPCFMRVSAAINHAQTNDDLMDFEPEFSFFTTDGMLRHGLKPAYLRAALVVPVSIDLNPMGRFNVGINTRDLGRIARAIERGDKPAGGITSH